MASTRHAKPPMANDTVKWAADLAHVREVSLLGTADLAFWSERLKVEGLTPTERDGRAQVKVIAADAKFMGIRFGELNFSVLAHRLMNGVRRDGAYLVRAFNSRRFFAFSERLLFATPYEHGDVRLSATAPASIELARRDGGVSFRAAMGAGGAVPAREPSRLAEGGWEGPVFLPGTRGGDVSRRKFFFARLSCHTATYPFRPACDSVAIHPPAGGGILADLAASRFAGQAWEIRRDARHAKSKTYRVDRAFASG